MEVTPTMPFIISIHGLDSNRQNPVLTPSPSQYGMRKRTRRCLEDGGDENSSDKLELVCLK